MAPPPTSPAGPPDQPSEETFSFATVPPVAADDDTDSPPTQVDPPAAQPLSREELKAIHEEPPPTIPGYEVQGELGRGAMGVVYKARQVGLNRIVALKMILHSQHAGSAGRARFKAEAEAVARLQHPNIVQIYEIGEHQGTPFFSLEFCSGGTLAGKLAGAPLEPRDAAQLLEVLARAIQAAHQANVIHRDLKPSNILLGADSTPKISDFGLAKKLDEASQTQHGAIMGTPSYMSPEQASGAGRLIGPLTDVYSLGAILYELLSGRPPFKAASVWDTLAMVSNLEPVPPGRLQPKVPRDLETICLKCLQKDLRRRYASAQHLAEDLRRFLNQEPILARPTPAWERAWKWASRRPAAAALVFAVGLLMVMSTFGGLFYGRYAKQQAAAQRLDFDRKMRFDTAWHEGKEAETAGLLALERGQQDEAERQFSVASDRLGRALELIDPRDEELRDSVEKQREKVQQHIAEQEARRSVQNKARAFLAAHREVLFHQIHPSGRDEQSSREQVLRLAPAALARLGIKVERPPANIVRALMDDRDRYESPHQFAQVLEGCFEVLLVWAEAEAQQNGEPGVGAASRAALPVRLGSPDLLGVRPLRLLAIAETLRKAQALPVPRAFYVRRSRYRARTGDERRAKEDSTRAAAMKPQNALDHFLAALEAWPGKPAEAAAACEATLRRQPDHFWARYLQSLFLLHSGKWAEAKAGFMDCLARHDFPAARLHLASALVELDELTAATEDFDTVLRQAKDPLTRYAALVNRTPLWVRLKRFDKAQADLNEAIALRPNDHLAHVSLAQVLGAQGNWPAAIAQLTKAIETLAPKVEDGGPKARRSPSALAELYFGRARAYRELKNDAAARKDFEAVVGLGPKAATRDRYLSALVELGYLKHTAGDYDGALADFAAALAINPDYAPALRQRAETLLKLDRHAEAGKVLDRYLHKAALSAEDRPIYLARGLIHAKMGEHLQAIEMFNRVLLIKSDAETHSHRGWSYLQMDAPRLALADFNVATREGLTTFAAVSGRSMAQVRLGKVPGAVADAEDAAKLAETPEALLLPAIVFARASVLTTARTPRSRDGATYEERAVELVEQALRELPREKRADFWNSRVQKEDTLAVVRLHPRLVRLAKGWASK
jgi:tetratricopeptide (TPR) repeat protein/tRNA A-37 threonylcarbamoyl transferase component Bud32